MSRKTLLVVVVSLAVLFAGTLAVTAQGPNPHTLSTVLGTGFTYQGQLKQNGAPVNGSRSLTFGLYAQPSGGSPLGMITQPVTITNGLFTTQLDFGNQFNGDARYLGIAIGADPELTPRQRLSAVPYALYSTGNWGLNGNAGTTSTNFLGTSDGMSLTLGVDGTAALRIYPNATSPNLIGGSQYNTLTVGIFGATIGGGGESGHPNSTSGNFAKFATIGGGEGNTASGDAATVAGGVFNTAIGSYATVGGGNNNNAGGDYSTVAGGVNNSAGNDSFAAGANAHADGDGEFVWADSKGFDFNSGGANQFAVRATGGISLVTGIDGSGNPAATVSIANGNMDMPNGNLSFGAQTRQMLNLYYQLYGIGIQNYTEYFRSDAGFAWFEKGVHSDTQNDPGAGGTRVMRLDSGGNLHVQGTISPSGADVAERIATSDALQPGDVVEIDADHDGQFRLAATPNSTAVAGVVSTQPGVSLNQNEAAPDAGGPQLALAGRVPVKVSAENGAIKPGDLLVASSTPGHAMRAPANPAPGTIIGKALGRLDDAAVTGVIDMLVMLR